MQNRSDPSSLGVRCTWLWLDASKLVQSPASCISLTWVSFAFCLIILWGRDSRLLYDNPMSRSLWAPSDVTTQLPDAIYYKSPLRNLATTLSAGVECLFSFQLELANPPQYQYRPIAFNPDLAFGFSAPGSGLLVSSTLEAVCSHCWISAIHWALQKLVQF